MGNSESSNPIRNMDKRTARREYKDDFIQGIESYKQKLFAQRKATPMDDANRLESWQEGDIKVFVRKRPIFQHEVAAGEFDVVTCLNNRIFIHDARMHADMKREMLHHHEFEFDHVFSDKVSNSAVYEATAKSLVGVACKGGFATAMVYGQTGSGKTFTMSSIYTQAAEEIFHLLHSNVQRFGRQPTVACSFIEIAGDNVSDLLNGFSPAQLRTAGDGAVHAFPVTEPSVTCAADLLALIQHGLAIRTTAATGVHDASSRSHAILRVYVQRYDLKEDMVEGTLTLVDLAGSEHRIDSMYHGKERRKETSQINASLMALKECIRARSMGAQSGQHVYRKSKLTMALKTSFTLPLARTIVIATVSPASKDTEHSLNTLRHACIMHGQDNSKDETRFVTGGVTTVEHIGDVNVSNIARKNKAHKKVHGEIENIKTSNGNNIDNKAARVANQEVELTDKMKRKMRRMSEAKSFNSLDSRIRDLLKSSRERLGNESNQLARFQRAVFADGAADEVADDLHEFHSSLNNRLAHEHLESDEDSIGEDLPKGMDNLYEDDFEQSPHNTVAAPVPVSARSKPIVQPLQVRAPSPSISMDQLHECVFVVEDIVHPSALTKQLEALFRLHGYDSYDIEHFLMSKGLKTKSNPTPVVSRVQPRAVQAAPQAVATPRISPRPVIQEAPLSARSGGSAALDTSRSAASAARIKSPYRRHISALNPPSAQKQAPVASSALSRGPSVPQMQPQVEIVQPVQPSYPEKEEVTNAMQRLQEEAKLRKARQDAAKAHRDDLQRKKVEKVVARVGTLPVREVVIEEVAPKELAEIDRLQTQLLVDDQAPNDQKMTSAAKYGIKKQIALLKATIIKKERAKAEQAAEEAAAKNQDNAPIADPYAPKRSAAPERRMDEYDRPLSSHRQQSQSDQYARMYEQADQGRPLSKPKSTNHKVPARVPADTVDFDMMTGREEAYEPYEQEPSQVMGTVIDYNNDCNNYIYPNTSSRSRSQRY